MSRFHPAPPSPNAANRWPESTGGRFRSRTIVRERHAAGREGGLRCSGQSKHTPSRSGHSAAAGAVSSSG